MLRSFVVRRSSKYTILTLPCCDRYEHPFLLSDNRHYAFYIWRWVYRAYPLARYILIPGYLLAGALLWRTLGTLVFAFGFPMKILMPVNASRFREMFHVSDASSYYRLYSCRLPRPRSITTPRTSLFHYAFHPLSSSYCDSRLSSYTRFSGTYFALGLQCG